MATSDWAQEQLCQGSLKTVWNRVVQEPRFDREPDRRGLPWAGAGDEELPHAGAVEELPMLEPGGVQLVGSSL